MKKTSYWIEKILSKFMGLRLGRNSSKRNEKLWADSTTGDRGQARASFDSEDDKPLNHLLAQETSNITKWLVIRTLILCGGALFVMFLAVALTFN